MSLEWQQWGDTSGGGGGGSSSDGKAAKTAEQAQMPEGGTDEE
jgi:hypothetical protein